MDKRLIGAKGEIIAARYLENKGYSVLDTNYRNLSGRQIGELDIVARNEKTGMIVFVEVKTRHRPFSSGTLPEENVTPRKLFRLDRIAQLYLKEKGLNDRPYRFDAISVWLDEASRSAKVRHLESL